VPKQHLAANGMRHLIQPAASNSIKLGILCTNQTSR
jgi:hypothetical protein